MSRAVSSFLLAAAGSVAHELIPPLFRSCFNSTFDYLFTRLSNNLTVMIDEDPGIHPNLLYEAAELYLSTKIGPDINRLRVSKTNRQKNIAVVIDKGQEIVDQFDNYQLKWRFVCVEPQNQNQNGRFNSERRSFELTFDKKFKDEVINSYLPFVLDRANRLGNDQRVLKLYYQNCPYEPSGSGGVTRGSVNLEHPATFETLAIDHDLKTFMIEDLCRFMWRKEFYERVGKAWKRGYLLYGPPGTGKSSLIAAMANYLEFDIYDLELTSIYSNSDLRRVLLSISNRSILVIEDIDCSVEVEDRKNGESFEYNHPPNTKFTSSSLLNFIDGLWSSCGDERIIVFTTNHKEMLDPALLRPGRLDVDIHVSYCSGQACNYLGLHETSQNPLYQEAQRLIETTKVTPAEVAEELVKSDDSSSALEGIKSSLKRKRIEIENLKDEKVGQFEGTTDKNEVKKGKKLKTKYG